MKRKRSSTSTLPRPEPFRTLLGELRPSLDAATKGSIKKVGVYGCALRAALAKSYEFALLVHAEDPPDHGFFITATLRGITEDLIALTYLGSLGGNERSEVVALLMVCQITEGIAAQSVFFNEERPWQSVLKPKKNAGDAPESKLRGFSAKLGWSGPQAWPSVWFMAKATGLDALYRYFYSATSKWVHFSPHVLLRMGWGGKKGKVSDETEWTFSTKNFTQYYTEFNQVCSVYLFLKFVLGPAAYLMPPATESVLKKLETRLNEILRWPETVTFEEMNLEGPHYLWRVLMRAAHEQKTKRREE